VPPLRGTNGEMGKEASSSGVVDIILMTSSSHIITFIPSSKLRIPCSISYGLCGPRRGGS
jgi:hypothetical protein